MQLTHADAPPQVPKHSVRFGFQLKVKCWETLLHGETEAKRLGRARWRCKLKQSEADAKICGPNGYIGLKSNSASSDAKRRYETALVI